MRRTQHDPTPHAQALPAGQDTGRPYPACSSDEAEQRYAHAVCITVAPAMQACAMHRARTVAQAAPEVRVAKVEAAHRALQEGTLALDGSVLAEKLLQATRAAQRDV